MVLETDIAVLSDEIYEQLIFGDAKATCFATLRPGLAERTITISGASKTYAMTGWRMGWALGRRTSSRRWATCRASRPAARAASASTRPWRPWRAIRSASRRCAASSRPGAIWFASGLAKMPGVRIRPPDGAFYAFFDVSAHFGRTLAGRPVTDSASLLPGRAGDGPRQPGAGLGLRRRGLRPSVVRHQPRAIERRTGPAGEVAGMTMAE